jgi:triosephosphate isomerase
MLADAGAVLVIVGHSERRAVHHETDDLVARKALAAWRAGLEPIVCVGETSSPRNAGWMSTAIAGHVRASLPDALDGHPCCIAYEPVWALRAGVMPTLADIEEAHRAIRATLIDIFMHGDEIPVLYGGSVTPANAGEILRSPVVGGLLVSEASRTAEAFIGVLRALVRGAGPFSSRAGAASPQPPHR